MPTPEKGALLKSPQDPEPRLAEQPPLQAGTPKMRKASVRNTKGYHVMDLERVP